MVMFFKVAPENHGWWYRVQDLFAGPPRAAGYLIYLLVLQEDSPNYFNSDNKFSIGESLSNLSEMVRLKRAATAALQALAMHRFGCGFEFVFRTPLDSERSSGSNHISSAS